MMPLMDGWKFMELARQRFPSLQVPIVLLSAVHELSIQAQQLGVTAFLPKPFDLSDVVRLAHELGMRQSGASRHA
jgi:CheY-like chemotaxis protein